MSAEDPFRFAGPEDAVIIPFEIPPDALPDMAAVLLRIDIVPIPHDAHEDGPCSVGVVVTRQPGVTLEEAAYWAEALVKDLRSGRIVL